MVFTDSLLGLRERFKQLTAIPKWAHPAIGGAATGALAVAGLLWLKEVGITGGGYKTLTLALTGSLTVKVLIGLCVLKLAATVASYSSGGVGGIFAPALFIGAMLGGTVGYLDVTLLHHSKDMIGAFALVGMGAVFAGIIRCADDFRVDHLRNDGRLWIDPAFDDRKHDRLCACSALAEDTRLRSSAGTGRIELPHGKPVDKPESMIERPGEVPP